MTISGNPSCQHRSVNVDTHKCEACQEPMISVAVEPQYVTSAPNAMACNMPGCNGGEGCHNPTGIYIPDESRAVQVMISVKYIYRCSRCHQDGTLIENGKPISWSCGNSHTTEVFPSSKVRNSL